MPILDVRYQYQSDTAAGLLCSTWYSSRSKFVRVCKLQGDSPHFCTHFTYAPWSHALTVYLNLSYITTITNRVHIVAQQANRYIVAFHITISRYCTIFTYQEAAVKRPEGGALVYTEVRSADASTCRCRSAVFLESAAWHG